MSRIASNVLVANRDAAKRAGEAAALFEGGDDKDVYVEEYVKCMLPSSTVVSHKMKLKVDQQAKRDCAVFSEYGKVLLDELAESVEMQDIGVIKANLKEFDDDMLDLVADLAIDVQNEQTIGEHGFEADEDFYTVVEQIEKEVARRAKKHVDFKVKMQGQLAGLCSIVTTADNATIVKQLKRMLADAEKELPAAKR